MVHTAPAVPDPRRIDILEPEELSFWTKALDVSAYELLVALDKVGTSADSVRRFLAAHDGGASH